MVFTAQGLVVASVVGACAVYAVWTLMPAGARRHVALAALRLPLPAPMVARLRRVAQRTGGCGCAGCDHAAPKADSGAARPVRFHPRIRR